MNVLLIGSGGREHALAWKLAQSTLLDALYIAPGNPGMARHGRLVDLDLHDGKALRRFLLDNRIRIVVVGPRARWWTACTIASPMTRSWRTSR